MAYGTLLQREFYEGWEDKIRMNLNEIRVNKTSWIDLAQHRSYMWSSFQSAFYPKSSKNIFCSIHDLGLPISIPSVCLYIILLNWKQFSTKFLISIPISLRSILILSSHIYLGLPKGLFPLGVTVKILKGLL